ncbi:MAG: DNA-3-methyladenine glycosylase [Nanoarchaeota archaeon]
MKIQNKRLSQKFFSKPSDVVARNLLGKVLCRRLSDGKVLRGRILETEAYFDENDPASRASKSGKKINKVHEMMLKEPGRILIYNVHKYFMLNFVTGKKNKASAVLIRSLEPLNFFGRCSGPGLMTECLKINKKFKEEFHGINCFSDKSNLWVEDSLEKIPKTKINRSFRIGVTEDLNEKHRYFINNSFINNK